MTVSRVIALGIVLLTTMAACGDSGTGPAGDSNWWVGSWNAVRGNDLPLPFRTSRNTVREIIVLMTRDSADLSTFVSNGTRTATNGQIFEDPVARIVKVTPAIDSVSVYDGPLSDIGQLALTFQRDGDTLVLANYRGGKFKFVRRP
ncbi:MAG: hypothetical protein ABIW79_02025 [Gemmatimonas sp.]